mmetsp:Transcript_3756/g.7231  ORF Transcript_3756/g.7231 Transcript_3756/m.7231 type:complete len:261 (-) Transcript_3756:185-967(-)
MERVRQLVSVDADEPSANPVHGLVEIFSTHILGVREVLVDDGRGILPEWTPLEHHSLPQQGLTLVDAHRESSRHWKIQLVFGTPLFIEGMTNFMNRPSHAFHPVFRVVACCDPNVHGPNTSCERMHGDVKAPPLHVESKVFRHFQAEIRLSLDIPFIFGYCLRQLQFRRIEHLLHKWNQILLESSKNSIQSLSWHAPLEGVECSIVYGKRWPCKSGHLFLEVEHCLQLRLEGFPVVLLSCLDPSVEAVSLKLRFRLCDIF